VVCLGSFIFYVPPYPGMWGLSGQWEHNDCLILVICSLQKIIRFPLGLDFWNNYKPLSHILTND
jgi:hypothetical protein